MTSTEVLTAVNGVAGTAQEVPAPPSAPAKRAASTKLTGAQKVAVVLSQLGAERSAKILASLSESEAIELTMEIANLPAVDVSTAQAVVEEFVDRAQATRAVGQGGVDTARAILEQRLGAKRAEEVLSQITNKLAVGPLAFLVNMDPKQVVNMLASEHPQTIAVLVAHMPPDDAARIVAGFPDSLGTEVAQRVATMDRVSPEAVSQAATLLDGKLRSLARGAAAATGGIASLVEILNRSDRSTERRVLEGLERRDPALAEAVRSKMFTFDDVAKLDDRSLQTVVRAVEVGDLALALKGALADVKDRFVANMTERSGAELTEELQVMGAVPASSVDAAQSVVVRVVRRLEGEGTLVLARDEKEMIA